MRKETLDLRPKIQTYRLALDIRLLVYYDQLPESFNLKQVTDYFATIPPINCSKMYWHNQLTSMKKAGLIRPVKEHKYVKGWERRFPSLKQWFSSEVKELQLRQEKLSKMG